MGLYTFNVLDDFKLAGMPVLDYSNSFLSNTKNEKFSDLPSMIAYMKDHPGEVTFATEIGSFTHIQVLAFDEAAGVEFNIVDAGTASQKIAELLGERLDVIGTQAGLVRDYLDTNEFTCLGVFADERLEGRPDIPTMKEQGVDVVFTKFFYVAAPNTVDDAVITAINEALTTVLENEGLKTYANSALVNLSSMTPADTEAYFQEQLDKYADLLADYIN